MALLTSISPKELQRIAARTYEGKTIHVRLCQISDEAYDESTLVSLWRTLEIGGATGYVAFSDTIGQGTYSTTNAQYELPEIEVGFTANNGTLSFNILLIYIEDYQLGASITETGFSFNSTSNTIFRNTGDFTTTFSANEYVKVIGSSGGTNDGTYQISTVNPTSMVLSTLTPLPATQGSGASVTLQEAFLYPYAILEENPNIALADGQTQTYRITLNTNDI